MNLAYLSPFANHLWQSTLFAGGAALLTLALRRNHARVRYWVWLAASCKFLLPFSLLIALGGQSRWRTLPETTPTNLSVVMDEVTSHLRLLRFPPVLANGVACRKPASGHSLELYGHADSSASPVRGGFAGGASGLRFAPGRRAA